jgi:hypothetical protein
VASIKVIYAKQLGTAERLSELAALREAIRKAKEENAGSPLRYRRFRYDQVIAQDLYKELVRKNDPRPCENTVRHDRELSPLLGGQVMALFVASTKAPYLDFKAALKADHGFRH